MSENKSLVPTPTQDKKQKNKESLWLCLKALFIGSAMNVPGISGGTLAVSFSLYDRLLQSMSHLFSDFKRNVWFLFRFGVCACLGLFLTASLIEWLLGLFPLPVSGFFIGAILGGIPVLLKTATRQKKLSVLSFVYIFIGIVCVFGISLIPEGLISFDLTRLSLPAVLMWIAVGIFMGFSLVLPGISTSHMLLVLGVYQSTIHAIGSLDFMYLAVLGGVLLFGIVAVVKPIDFALSRYPHASYCLIIGFVLGSLSEVVGTLIFPCFSAGLAPLSLGLQSVAALLLLALGFFVSYRISAQEAN